MKVNAILLKPLDGYPVGAPRAFERDDFERLRALAAVREATDEDETEAVPDEDALILERLRHPVDGPRALAVLKQRLEDMQAAQTLLQAELAESRDVATANATARDAHIAERDAALTERDNARAEVTSLTTERDAAVQALADRTASRPGGKPKSDG